MWFTDSDKVLWTLVVCIFINIFGFTFMIDFFSVVSTLVTALLSSWLTLRFKNRSDKSNKKEKFNRIERSFKEILSVSVLKCLEKAYDISEENITAIERGSINYAFPDRNALDIDLIELFGRNDIIEIFINKDIPINYLFNINFSLKSIFSNNDSTIIRKYEDKKAELSSRKNVDFLNLEKILKEDKKKFEKFNEDYARRFADNKTVTIKNVESYKLQCYQTINNINVLLQKF